MSTERIFESVYSSGSGTKFWAGPDVAQTFKARADHNITAVEINWGRLTVPPATITIRIEGVDGNGKPDGNVLATSLAFPYNDLILYPDTRKDKISFISPCNVTKDTFYAVTMIVSTDVILILRLGTQPTGWNIYTDGPAWGIYGGYGAVGLKVYGTVVVPTLTTQAVDNISTISGKGNGTITDLGGDINCTKRGFCYNKTGNPTVADNVVQDIGTYDLGAFGKYMTGLDVGQKYYVKAVAYNVDGYGYGNEVEFTTLTTAEITTEAVSEKTYQAAMGNGTVVAGEPTERGFEIKLSYSGTLGDYVFHHVAGFEGDVTYIAGSWQGTLIKTETETGTFSPEAFELVLGYPSVLGNPSYIFSDKLFECESYTYRAYMVIGDTTYHGEWVAFSTLCYPVGHQDDNTPPIYIPLIIPPIVPLEDPITFMEPDFIFPEFPPMEFPEMPNGYWSGMFYYRKAYTKKDLDDLRRKCRIFLDNSVEYALVLNHNMKVLQQFLNMMHVYMDTDEYNGFRDLIPTQHLNALAREPLDVSDFKAIINNFISNSVNNTMNVNNNFRLIRNGLGDYIYSEDVGFIEEKVSTRVVRVNDPDVEMLKKKIDTLSRETSSNYAITQHNLYVVRAMIL